MIADLPAWIFSSICAIGFLVFTGHNDRIAWQRLVRSAPAPSFAPIAGGCLGVGAILAAPIGAWTDRLPYVLIPLVLDFGTLPYLALVVREGLRNRGPAKEMTLEEYRAREQSRQSEEDATGH